MMKCALGVGGVRAAWTIITTGRRIVGLAERMEAQAQEPYSWRCNLAWRFMNAGERVVAFGEALEACVDSWARRAGCDMELALARLT